MSASEPKRGQLVLELPLGRLASGSVVTGDEECANHANNPKRQQDAALRRARCLT